MSTEKQITANSNAAVRLNAVSHGLLSQEVLLPGEDEARLAALRENYMAEYQPQGEMETFLVERIVCAEWRLKRGLRIERHDAVIAPLEVVAEKDAIIGGDYRYPSWLNYMRYETALERQLYRAKHELERCQRARRGENLPAPAALDVDVSDPDEI